MSLTPTRRLTVVSFTAWKLLMSRRKKHWRPFVEATAVVVVSEAQPAAAAAKASGRTSLPRFGKFMSILPRYAGLIRRRGRSTVLRRPELRILDLAPWRTR